MKKLELILVLLLFIPLVSAIDLSVTPATITKSYTKGGAIPENIILEVKNNDNQSFASSITKSGLASSIFSLSADSLSFIGIDSKALTVSFQNLNADTPAGQYTGSINFNGTEKVSISITVIEEIITGCRIVTYGGDYRDSISRNIEPFKKRFNFKIAKECGIVTVNNIREDGTFTLESGTQPIALTGLVPTGEYDGGELLAYEIEFNVKDLSQGTYDSRIIIEASDSEDKDISKVINFQIKVLGSKPTPYTQNDTIVYPNCNPDTNNLLINNSYKIMCSNVVSPGLKIRFLPDLEYFEGITVESKEDLNQVIYHFKPIKEGSAEIRVSYELSGSPIGASPVFKYQISISPISFGTKMKFHFFPPLAELKEGDIVSVLVKDNQSDYILGAVNLYLNGIKMEGNSFIVEQGKSYTLSASLTGYSPLEEIIKIENPDIILYLSKATPDVGDIITVIPTPQNLTIYLELNGTSINNNFIINNAGTYTVTATASGYKKTNITFDVIDKLVVLTTIPEKVKLGQKLIIELSREAPWSLTYRANNKTDTYPETIYSSTSQVINLEIPNKKGLYFFYVDGSELIVWDNRGMSFNWKWILVILAIIGILIFGSKLIKPKGPRRFAGLSSQGENIVETIR